MLTAITTFDEITCGGLASGKPDIVTEVRRKYALLKAGVLRYAIPKSSDFSSFIWPIPRQCTTARARIPRRPRGAA
jgi:hypothetical protein